VPTVVQLRELRKTYFRSHDAPPVHALAGVDLDIARGQYVAIMGPSGSGKSTLMNVLGCLDRPTAGTYLLEGQDVAGMDDDALSRIRGRRIGFVFQSFNLIPQLSVLENVQVPLFYQGVPPRVRAEKAEAALDRVGLGDRVQHRPAELSGGQQQRVAIARALINEPAILLADEPTGNLDSKTGEAILTMLDELHAAGLTLIMVTHDQAVADRTQRTVTLRDGLIASDEHAHAAPAGPG